MIQKNAVKIQLKLNAKAKSLERNTSGKVYIHQLNFMKYGKKATRTTRVLKKKNRNSLHVAPDCNRLRDSVAQHIGRMKKG